jgi:small GTP-binding protein
VPQETIAATLLDVIDSLAPQLPPERRLPLREAALRARAGQVRVLVLGETKRGKSTLVNKLFDIDLLPTGALPLTAVATTVTAGTPLRAEVHYQDGTVRPIEPPEIATLVTQQHNPDNAQRVDRVALVAPSPHLPYGTEVVDTPGTGSVHAANTTESARARSTVDIAVLVVAADPPISAAEVELLRDVTHTAAAALVVINKIDLVAESDIAGIIAFTRRAVTDPVGADVPVLATSLRDRGVDDIAGWLTARIIQHGTQDAVTATARALRREAHAVHDRIRVEQQLLQQTERQQDAAVAALEAILRRARDSADVTADRIRGAARRALARLNFSHTDEATAARKAARAELGDRLRGPGTPEEQAEHMRARLADLAARRCSAWFDHMAAELGDALHSPAYAALTELRDDLARARQAAEHTLKLRLADVDSLPGTPPPRPPRLDPSEQIAWQELITSTIAAHLPPAMRRRRLHRNLANWADLAIPQPFGRARATLQDWLDQTAKNSERDLAAIWREQLAALEHGLDEARAHGLRDADERTGALKLLTDRMSTVEEALTDLDVVAPSIAPVQN